MNYRILDENGGCIAVADTQNQGVVAGRKWQNNWAMNGCPRVRHFTVNWNGTRPAVVFDSRNAAALPVARQDEDQSGALGMEDASGING